MNKMNNGASREKPPLIWLVGLPRSGTSWLGKIFDSHPSTAYRSEPDNYPTLEDLPLFPEAVQDARYAGAVQAFAATLPRLSAYRFAAKPPVFAKSYRSGLREYGFHVAAFAARVGSQIYKDFPVIGARADRGHPPPVIVWKSINSLGRFGLVMHSLPHIKGIHIIRHPCGHIGSLLRGESESAFGDSGSRSEYYGVFEELLKTPQAKVKRLTLEELRHLTPEERLAWHWLLVNEKALQEADDCDRATLVRYEDLCEDPIAVSQTLFQSTALAWHGQTENFINQSTSTNNQKYFSVFKDPSKSVHRWREELSQDRIEKIMAIVSRSEKLSKLYPSV